MWTWPLSSGSGFEAGQAERTQPPVRAWSERENLKRPVNGRDGFQSVVRAARWSATGTKESLI